MGTLRVPAARVKQGGLVLYTTGLRVKDVIANNFYNVEKLDPSDPGDKGYQRVLNLSRARRLADYILKGQDEKDAFLPTSVFLATDKSIYFDEQVHVIEFDPELIGPFSVVDVTGMFMKKFTFAWMSRADIPRCRMAAKKLVRQAQVPSIPYRSLFTSRLQAPPIVS
jgi:hypothetical protein